MSTLRDRSHRHDQYYARAKREDYAARSVYKLLEINERFHLLRPGMRVLDLGCRPGSWLKYAAEIAGPRGAVVGLDRTPLDKPVPGARVVVGDVHQVTAAELLGDLAAFDVVLSDMAPDTCGIRNVDQARSEALFERALDLALEVLPPGGHFVGKLFQGPDQQRLLGRCRAEFGKAQLVKPKSSRKESIEQFVVAIGRTG
ncbi:MAG TPA: RlmE family RNA methyltransferase [Polyangia bacterium]|jgi:23S rRNA (uridine2552-2'-O)-methyltransferase